MVVRGLFARCDKKVIDVNLVAVQSLCFTVQTTLVDTVPPIRFRDSIVEPLPCSKHLSYIQNA